MKQIFALFAFLSMVLSLMSGAEPHARHGMAAQKHGARRVGSSK